MTKFVKQGSLLLPIPKPEPVKVERPTEWDCPQCGVHFDNTKYEGEEYTVGSLRHDAIPHIICPNCTECMGCY